MIAIIDCDVDIPFATVVATTVLILLSAIYYWTKNRGLLPGPRGLPYLGLYPVLTDENITLKLEEYKQKYGDMFSFTYTGRLFINLGTIKAMKEIQLQKSDCFLDRFDDTNLFGKLVNKGHFMTNGEPWKIQRKFFIQKFKNYGLNAVRDDLAGPVYDSLNAAIEGLKALYKQPINIVEFLSQHCSITMRKILFGEKGVTDEEISRMLVAFSGAFEGSIGVNMLLFGPIAKLFLHTKPQFRQNVKCIKTMKNIILDCVKRIEASMKDSEPTCIVEEFYKERNERKSKNDPTWQYFSDEAIVESLFQFVGDGILSVAAVIAGIFYTILEHPEEQEKLYSEIIDVVGLNRQPTMEDRPNLPYTNAFLSECFRLSKFLFFFPSLECTKETTVRGYKIPVGSITLLNFWSAHHDEKTFEDPHAFKPSRYISSEGKPKAESPVLFGMGKRVCTGEPFVMLQTYLFLTTIVKNFKLISSNAPTGNAYDFLISGKLEINFIPRKEV